jgi:hypothetical protein
VKRKSSHVAAHVDVEVDVHVDVDVFELQQASQTLAHERLDVSRRTIEFLATAGRSWMIVRFMLNRMCR